MKIFNIPGTSFSPRRVLGIDKLKRSIARATGIPTTKQGIERKIGNTWYIVETECDGNEPLADKVKRLIFSDKGVTC